MSSEKKPNKYGKKTSFSREKHHVYSEADIERVDSKQNQWNDKRKEEREHNLKVASGLNEVEEKKEKKEKNPGNYADDIIDVEDDEDIEFDPKMTLVMHGVPMSYNINNVMRTFQYYGDVKSLTTSTNIDSTYTITVVPNEWNENIALIQREIANNGYVMVADYKVTK
jgi:hypothetical protein